MLFQLSHLELSLRALVVSTVVLEVAEVDVNKE
jgi:hypothetical protein